MSKLITCLPSGFLNTSILAVDLETTGIKGSQPNPRRDKTLLVALTNAKKETIVLEPGDWLPKLFEVLDDPDVTILMHNSKFDLKFLRALGYEGRAPGLWDTMLVEQLITAGTGDLVNLASVAWRRCSKLLDKTLQESFLQHVGEFSQAQIEYAGGDTEVLLDILVEQKDQCKSLGLERVAKLENSLAPVVADMEWRGVGFDIDRWNILVQEEHKVAHEAEQRFARALNFPTYQLSLFGEGITSPINMNSHKQLKEALNTAGIRVSNTQEKTLLAYMKKHTESETLIEAVIKHSKAMKRAGFAYADKIDPRTGRIHTHYGQARARTGRFSCVPTTAEALTSEGWKGYKDLTIGDSILGFDLQQEQYIWTKIRNIHTGRDWLGKIKLNKGGDYRYIHGPSCTANHRWIVKTDKIIGFALSKALPRKCDILLQPKKLFPEPKESILTDDEAFLYGWYLTDGCKVGCKRQALEISLTKCRSIDMLRDWLDKSKIPYTLSIYEYTRDKHYYVTRFYIGCKVFDDILKKVVAISPSNLIMNISHTARQAMFAAMLEADGSRRKDSTRYDRFGNKEFGDKQTNVYFELLSVSLGQPYSYRRSKLKTGMFITHYLLKREKTRDKNYKWRPEYLDDVWCPETECGTWVMRQGHDICVTGNSSGPNLQNVPKQQSYRSLFIAAPGCYLVTSDWAQQEMRIMAFMSGDKHLRELCLSTDFHLEMARLLYSDQTIQKNDPKRHHAKCAGFAMVYGATAETVADTIGIKVWEARPIVDGILKSFPDVTAWAVEQCNKAKREGWVSTLSGRRRWFTGADEDPSLATGPRNTPIQGSAADMLKQSMVEIFDTLRNGGYESAQVLTVHDEIVVETPEHEKDDVVPLVEKIMVDVGQRYLEGLPTPVDCIVAKEWRKE